jgi:hypothetical protein
VRVRYVEPPDTEFEDLARQFLDLVGFNFEPNSSGASQKLALVRDIRVEKRDVEIVSQANEVPFGIGLRDFSTEYIAIEFANPLSILLRNEN